MTKYDVIATIIFIQIFDKELFNQIDEMKNVSLMHKNRSTN
jgi:hypothetical protein